MIEACKTVIGVRPELAALPVNPPFGYVGGIILPKVKVALKVGDVAYAALLADSAAQTGRSLGAAPSATNIGEATDTFTAIEYIKRYTMDWTSVPLYGGVPRADEIGAKASKRSVMNAVEAAQLAVVLDASGTSITSAIIDGIAAAADSVRLYSGKTALLINDSIYRWLIGQTEIKNLLVRSFQGLTPAQAMSLSPDVFKAMLQGLLRIDEVLIADWSLCPYAYRYTGAIIKIPDGTDEFSYAYQAELGRTFVYWPDGGTEYEVNTDASENLRSNVYDACSWLEAVQFNAAAKSLLTFGGQKTTTTTTTATTGT